MDKKKVCLVCRIIFALLAVISLIIAIDKNDFSALKHLAVKDQVTTIFLILQPTVLCVGLSIAFGTIGSNISYIEVVDSDLFKNKRDVSQEIKRNMKDIKEIQKELSQIKEMNDKNKKSTK